MDVQGYVACVARVAEVKFMKLIDSYKHSYLILICIGMMPILISIVILLTKYGLTSFINEIKGVVGELEHVRELKNHQQSAEFAEWSIFWSFGSSLIMSTCWCKYSVTFLCLNDFHNDKLYLFCYSSNSRSLPDGKNRICSMNNFCSSYWVQGIINDASIGTKYCLLFANILWPFISEWILKNV